MDSNFFALISRMRYIARWGLMRNALPENIQEHSHMVAVLAHALGVIRRDIFGQPCDVNALATAALYHDASEILTGDLPTPIKYHNAEIMSAYHAVEDLAVQKLLGMLPPELRATYAAVLDEDKDPAAIVEERGMKQVSDTGAIEAVVDAVLAANPDKVAQYQGGKTGLIGFFVGQCMKEMRGQGNPKLINELLAKKLG